MPGKYNDPAPARRGDHGNDLSVLRADGSHLRLQPGEGEAKPAVDVVFVFDTTGSMSDKIDGLIDSTSTFVAEMARLSLDWRVSCVPFGDLTVPGDRIVTEMPFVSDRVTAQEMIRGLPRFSGGGNLGESSAEALIAGAAMPFRAGAVPVLVLLTDEPALLHRVGGQEVLRSIAEREALCFVASPDTSYFKDWARLNGGAWSEIGVQMDYSELTRILIGMVRRVAQVSGDVHKLAGGSVRRFLSLDSGG